MSIRHMSEVWSDDYYQQGDKMKLLLALALADCASSDTGLAWPSIETLARKSRTSIRGAQETIRELQKDGKIEVQEGKGPNRTNLYRVLISPRTACTLTAEIQRDTPHSVHPAQRAPRKRAPEKAAADCTPTIRNGKEPVKTLSARPTSDHTLFIQQWSEKYPEFHAGNSYKFQDGKDAKAVQSLLKTGKSPEELIRMSVAAWKYCTGFNLEQSGTISGLNSRFNEIRNELNKKRPSAPAGPVRAYDAPSPI